MKNLKIGTRLLVTFLVVALLASLGGAVGLAMLLRSDTLYSEALVNNGFAQGDIGSFNTYLNKGGAIVRDIIFLNDKADLESAQKEMDSFKQAAADAFVRLKEVCQTPQELQYVAVIDEKLPKYEALRDQVVALGLQNKNDEALALFRNEARPLLDACMTAADSLSTLNRDLGTQVSGDLTRQTQTSVLIIVSTIVVSLLCSVVLALAVAKSVANPVKELEAASRKMAEGEYDVQLTYHSKDELGVLSDSMRTMSGMTSEVLSDTQRTLSEIAGGNFDVSPKAQYRGVFTLIESSLVHIVKQLSDMMRQVGQASDQVSMGSDQVSAGAQALSQGATEQASSVEELAATIAEISTQITETAQNAQTVSGRAKDVGEEAQESNRRMQDMLTAMDEITKSSGEIGKIIKTIEDIAFQTNILALNAAVEAARAGAAGKGFAVVADEVRNLASKSAQASKNTASLIEGSLRAVSNGTKIAGDTAQSLESVVGGVSEVSQIIEKISGASANQARSISQITAGIDQISSVVQTNSATAEESAASSEELSSQAQIMKNLVGQFRLRRQDESEAFAQPTGTRQKKLSQPTQTPGIQHSSYSGTPSALSNAPSSFGSGTGY